MPAHSPLLSVRGVSKRYANGTVALAGVDMDVTPGSIHGLVGANGAGKSTLFKILSGALGASSGSIRWHGEEIAWSGPGAARAAGISTIHQHIPLVGSLTVVENVFLGEPGGLFRRRALRARYAELTDRVGYSVAPDRLVDDLPVGQRQMVAIMHALASRAELVLMDEPTASLSQAEAEQLFETVRRLRERDGVGFVYCSHFLDDVLALTDVVTVLRDGRIAGFAPSAELEHERLVEMLVGRRLADLEQEPRPQPERDAEVALEVEHLSSPNGVADVSFAVRRGEVVGLAGLLGSGRSEVLHAIFGADPAASGTVRVHGRALGRGVPAAVRAGIALVPEERLRQALLPDWSISRNASLPDLARLSRRRLVPDGALERRRAEAAIAELGIRAPSPDTPVSSLSGGNAQKVAFAKWIYGDPDVVLLDEPTHGVDIGAKYDIVRTIRALARSGKAVILVSSEFEELLAEADRILVMDGGAVVHERASAELTQESLLGLVSGLASAGATA